MGGRNDNAVEAMLRMLSTTAFAGPVSAVSRILNTPRSVSLPHLMTAMAHRGRGLRGAAGGRIAVVTGASSGIGNAVAHDLARAGAVVVLVARSRDKLATAVQQIEQHGGAAHACVCDLTDGSAIAATVDEILDRVGGVDILVNNAGRSIRRSLALSYDRFDDFERTIQLNYFAAMRLTLAFLPGMRERRFGNIVNISSAGVLGKAPRFGAYIASKAALDTACDAFQAETRSDNVRFTTIHMPLVRTPMISPTELYDRLPALTPEEASAVICGAIVDRPRRLSPAIGRWASLADSVAPEVADLARDLVARQSGDSAAANRVTEPDATGRK